MLPRSGEILVTDAVGGRNRLYSRNGAFRIDNDGYLENGGNYLMGWPTDANGKVVGNDTSASALQAIDTNAVATSAAPSSKIAF